MSDSYTHINDDSFETSSRRDMDANHPPSLLTNLVTSPTNEEDEPICAPRTSGESQPLKSPVSPTRSISGAARSTPKLDALSRFRKATRQVIAVRRFSNYAMRGQGVDATDMDSVFGCIENDVNVMVMDMNESRYTTRTEMNNAEFLRWLEQPRPSWSRVRWININGMSWDVIKAISLKYKLHQLAVEDLLHVPQRTKVDIYPQQTYIACTLLTLMETLEDGSLRQVDPLSAEHGINPDVLHHRIPLDKLDRFKFQYPIKDNVGGLQVHMEQVTIFLLEDGTLVTIFQVSGKSVTAPIAERVTHNFSIVRKNNDASFLLQSVIDGIVDHAIPIADAFRQEINELEMHVLALPRMKFTKQLHQMMSQLSMLKRTLAPTQTLVHALRGKDERSPLTPLARTYMGDVMDHCNTMVEDIDSMLALCEKLINMPTQIFNIIALRNELQRISRARPRYVARSVVQAAAEWVLMAFALEWFNSRWKASQVEKRLSRKEPININPSRARKSHDWCV
ncbi:hypothetical protein BGX31_005506 [Mortierella sp. GBA43]|nr:hypothetical protein BGX31_005506 [Mortierella sp. GBA43]